MRTLAVVLALIVALCGCLSACVTAPRETIELADVTMQEIEFIEQSHRDLVRDSHEHGVEGEYRQRQQQRKAQRDQRLPHVVSLNAEERRPL